jgi:hypothetical protein
MKNSGYSPEEIKKVENACQQAGLPFAYRTKDEENHVFANVLFTGKYMGAPVVFDTFIYTLESEYMSAIFEDAREEIINTYPEYAEADFEADEGPHIDLLEEIASELAEEDDYSIQEFVDIEEEAEYGVALDVCLNVPEITDEVIGNFVTAFKTGTFQPDETFYSFELE